jgi:hypothetical protein
MSRSLKLGPEKSLHEIRNRVASGIPFDDADAEQWKLPDPVVPGIGYDRPPLRPKPNPIGIPDDLSIPEFMRRT